LVGQPVFGFLNLLVAGNPKATGDILGRDLNIYGLGWLGHVGIWDGRRVLEVLNKNIVIQKNSLSSFKKASSYWGTRYGRGSRHYKVIRAGWRQRYYSPTYVFSATWREGKYVRRWVWDRRYRRWRLKWVKQSAKFRCDSFVYYSYMKGIGVRLVANNWITPRIIYNSMPKNR